MLANILSQLGEYKEEQNKLVFKYCPFCHGGENRDKWSFVIHEGIGGNRVEDMFYSCLRGKCGVKGNIMSLSEKLSLSTDKINSINLPTTKKLPNVKLDELTDSCRKYINLRGIKDETIKHFKLQSKNGNIAIPFYHKNKLYFIKYRIPRKPLNGEPKTIREKGATESILLNMNKSSEKLIICEGEFDAMIVWQAVGDEYDVVSIPSGTLDFKWLDLCYEYVHSYSQVLLWGDNDEAGQQFNAEASKRIGLEVCSIIPHLDTLAEKTSCSDPNELYFKHGEEAIITSIDNRVDCGDGLAIPISNIKYVSNLERERVSSKYNIINSCFGGYTFGEFFLVTGHSGNGKTTWLANEMLWTISEGHKVGVFSGEQNKEQLKRWFYTIAGGQRNIAKYDKISGKNMSVLSNSDVSVMDKFFADKLYLFDKDKNGRGDKFIISTIKYLYQRYGVKIFLIDNLMSIKFRHDDEFEEHKEFIADIKLLLDNFGIMVFLVAHPRKDGQIYQGKAGESEEDSMPTLSKIKGTSDIVNLADNVIVYHRMTRNLSKQYARRFNETMGNKINNAKSIIAPLKNREEGELREIGFMGFTGGDKRIHDIDMMGNPIIKKYKFEWEE